MELQRLSPDAIPAALDRAEQYRLLNEPEEAESICLDVLDVEAHNQRAVVLLLLALTDQLSHGSAGILDRARRLVPRLESDYEQAYYDGLVCERQAKNMLRKRGSHSGTVAYDWFQVALEQYGKAMEIRPAGNDESLLRWNACLRHIDRHPHCAPDERQEAGLGIE